MELNLEIISKNLKLLRTVRGISQETLAADVCITRSTYSDYETGVKIPDLQTLDALSALYGIGFESLVNYDLSAGLLNRIYFNDGDKDLAKLLNNYESLSIASKNMITERLNILLHREAVIYNAYRSHRKYSNGK